MDHIKERVDQLKRKYNTTDPYKIAEQKKILVQFEFLGSIWGYYSNMSRIPIIHINEEVRDKQRLFVVAHELGHAILHPNENTSFLNKYTLFSTDSIEKEANYFASMLLFSDKTITKDELLYEYGIPLEYLQPN
ncbi:ImmA/IrrE family metallo-endopeptidase [Geomicrobium sediminis]|uniref:Zn-dependent peptidase ImmA (M78 family) n=1 Tax=Geomicrobium sediminis TaxID=1347788 RepID=A0ABS2P743_9BACL|nr:ImmA/IrrE family metallo-endopeptidase [Geomicrobium sediminis]MBM7631137.1 Zn-dependent peptidase ImmA (M78 family) [Geomicrobium sediminis]